MKAGGPGLKRPGLSLRQRLGRKCCRPLGRQEALERKHLCRPWRSAGKEGPVRHRGGQGTGGEDRPAGQRPGSRRRRTSDRIGFEIGIGQGQRPRLAPTRCRHKELLLTEVVSRRKRQFLCRSLSSTGKRLRKGRRAGEGAAEGRGREQGGARFEHSPFSTR
jgi:hypothetical protein